jgi:tape measure domain-containing protein
LEGGVVVSQNIEDQIVSMQFDNKQFESGVSTSMGTLDKLKSSLAFPDAGKGLADVTKAAGRFNLNPMSSAIEGVSKTWLAMTTVALTAISNITNRVLNAGISIAKSFTIDPLKQGFSEYEKNLNSTQTIIANTGKTVGVVNKYLNDLNHYSDQTIYNFGQMADSIGKFTAAGVEIDAATSSIKGMANTAALGGASVEQLNTAMYQTSQALASGTIRLMDFNSLQTAGLAGQKVQKQLFQETARTMKDEGAAMQAAIDKHGNFRDSLQEGWFSADIFNKSMKVMAGNTLKSGKTVAFTVKQLQGMGYSLQAAKDLNKMSKAAIDSATKVKTLSQLMDVAKEAIGSGWAKIFQDVFGDFAQATKLWTGVSNTVTGAIGKVFNAVDKMLVGWRDLGGFEDLWTTVGNVFKVIGNLLHPLVALFQAILPPTKQAGSGLAKFTSFLATFTGWLVKLTDPIGNFKINLGFLGKLFKIVGSAVSSFVGALKPLLPIMANLSAQVGDMFNQGMEIAGNLIAGWTAGLDPKALKEAAINLADSWIQWIKDALGIHSPATTMIPIGENIVMGILEGLNGGAQILIAGLAKMFKFVGQALKAVVENVSWSDVLDTLNSALFIGLVLTFRKFLGSFTGLVGSFQKVMSSAGGVLDQVTSNLKTMQSQVRSEIVRNIAISVAILAASALLLSTVDSKKLGVSLGAIAGLMVTLISAMGIVGKGSKKMDAKAIAKQTGLMLAMSTAMVAFATSILILTGAVALMGQLDMETIKKGLIGVGGVIALITTTTAIMGKTGGGATMIGAATAMTIMALALTEFVGVMKLYQNLDWKTLVQGGGSAAAVMVALGLAMRTFGKGSVGGATGLIIASAALVILAKALQMLASIGLGDMIKTVVALDFALASIATAAMAMSAAEGGAGSMLVMAAAIIVLAKALQILGSMSLWDIIKALGALVVTLALVAGAAILLTPAVPLIAALGSALLLVGLAVLAAGVGILAFATALGIVAVVGPAAFAALADGIDELIAILPKLGEAFGLMLVSFFTGIAKGAGPLAKALGKLLGVIIDELIKLVPKAGRYMTAVINELIRVVFAAETRIYRAGIRFIMGFLDALIEATPKFIRKGTDLIIAFIEGLSKNGVRMINAAGEAVLNFLTGLDAAIVYYEPQIIEKGFEIAGHLVQGMVEGIKDGIGAVGEAAGNLAQSALDKIKHPWEIFSPSHATRRYGNYFGEGAALGIKDKHAAVEKESEEMANKALSAMTYAFKNSKKVTDGFGELRPKITPILDLAQLERDASLISAKMGSHSIRAEVSRNTARDIAGEHAARNGSGGNHDGGDTYEFVQNIYSPKPVNHVKVYRGTKSQIALFKEVKGK